MLTIRLARIGKKKKPFYRVVVIERTRPRNGRVKELVGTYDPLKKPAEIKLDAERIKYWLGVGAQPSDTVRSFHQAAENCVVDCFCAADRMFATILRPHAHFGRRHTENWSGPALSPPSDGCTQEQTMKELVETIARALVDRPEEVQVRTVGGTGTQVTVLELRVHAEDLGKVIGRQGRTAKAIRTLLSASGMKLRKRFTLEILED